MKVNELFNKFLNLNTNFITFETFHRGQLFSLPKNFQVRVLIPTATVIILLIEAAFQKGGLSNFLFWKNFNTKN